MTVLDTLTWLLNKAEAETPKDAKLIEINVPVDLIKEILKIMAAQPEIIRCHECSGFDDETEDDFGSGFCYMWGSETEANEFCSYAKRRKPDD